MERLNTRQLPLVFFAVPEQFAGGLETEVVTLQKSAAADYRAVERGIVDSARSLTC